MDQKRVGVEVGITFGTLDTLVLLVYELIIFIHHMIYASAF